MQPAKEIIISASPPGETPGGRWFGKIEHLRPFWRRWKHLPGLHAFGWAARRALAVAEPAGKACLQDQPARDGRASSRGLTAISANLWHDWPRHRDLLTRLERFARLVESQAADVLLLQEVARTPGLWVDRWLAERLGMAYLYSRANGHQHGIGFEEGLAVFSRYPLSEPRLRQLDRSANPFVRRLALGAELETPYGRLLTFSVHLGLAPKSNRAQLDRLQTWIGGQGSHSPALIGGDFNAPETSRQIQSARQTWVDTYRSLHPGGEAATHELRTPVGGLLRRSRLDYIFLQPGQQGWQVVEARVLETEGGAHSDHRAVLARLAPPETQAE